MTGIAHQRNSRCLWPRAIDDYRDYLFDYLFDNYWHAYPRFADVWSNSPASVILEQIMDEIDP